jgi:hypothetical protein
MTQASLFDRIASALFGGGKVPVEDAAERQLIADLIESVVEAVEPKMRLNGRYRQKLEPSMRRCIAHLRSIAREGLEPVLLARSAWSDDPHVNAFFATANDVPACLGRSRELRAFFDSPANHNAAEAFALLAMKKEESAVFGTQLQGDKVQHDVARTSVSFSGHRLVAPSASLQATRLEIGKRIIQRLAQIALSHIVSLDMKATELAEHKAYLGARMRMLALARDGMEGIVKDPSTIDEQMKSVERELKRTVDGYIEAKSGLATLDGYIGHVQEVFSHPDQHVLLSRTSLQLDRMGIKVEGDAAGPVNQLNLVELSIGDELRVAIAIARCPRSELPPKEDLVAQAERYL